MNTSKKAPKAGKGSELKISPAVKSKNKYNLKDPRTLIDSEDEDEDFDIPLDDDIKDFDDFDDDDDDDF